jgi:hypothetical protein
MTPLEEGAIRIDAYLDELLATRGMAGPRVLPEPIEPELEAVSRLAQRALARFHPSFSFEERLATRLAQEAAGGSPLPSGIADGSIRAPSSDAVSVPVPITGLELRGRNGRLLGGAIASGVIASGVSIAGAALIARARRVRAEQRWQDLG